MLKQALRVCFALGCGVLLMTPLVFAQPIHPFELPQPADAPERLLAVIEIPKGSQVKYEIDPVHGGLVVDRFLPDTQRYPTNYGGLPSLWAADGDLLDVLVLSPMPLVPGALIEVRVIGLARMLDGEEQDHKIIVRPIDLGSDERIDLERTDGLSAEEMNAIASFFKSYKASPDHDNPIQWLGFGSSAEAKALIQELLQAEPSAEAQELATAPGQLIHQFTH